MKRTLKKFALICGLMSIATMSFAPFKDLRKGVKIEPEKSEAQRSIDQQQFQGLQGEMAPAPVDTDLKSEVKLESAEVNGSDALIAAEDQEGGLEESRNAKETLIEAEKLIQAEKSGGFNWAVFGVLGAFAGGVFFGFRHYASKNIPDMPDNRYVKW